MNTRNILPRTLLMVFTLTLASAVFIHSPKFIQPVKAGPASARPATAADDGFSMIMASDTQFNWWREKHDPNCDKDDCINDKGKETNGDMKKAMEDITNLGRWPSTLWMGADAPIIPPSGIIINGDLTSFGHKGELDLYKSYYPASGFKYQIYPGLGNHDYYNNVPSINHDNCDYDAFYYPDHNRCAKEMIWYMAYLADYGLPDVVSRDITGHVSVVNTGGYEARFTVTYKQNGESISKDSGHFSLLKWKTEVIPKDATDIRVKIEENSGVVWKGDDGWVEIDNYELSTPRAACYELSGTTLDPHSKSKTCPQEWPSGSEGSLSYAFEKGKYHFVQLQYRPDHEVNLKSVVTLEEVSSFGILGSPSFKVTQSYDWLKSDLAAATAAGKYCVVNMHDFDPGDQRFLEAIKGQNVVAIFAGHIHQDYGKVGTLNNGVYEIPWFRSGSAECERFLYAEFHQRYFNVGAVNTSGGRPAFVMDESDVCDTRHLEGDIKYWKNGGNPVPKTFTINRPPTVSASPQTSPAREGAPVSFQAEGTDPDGDDLTYQWSFGDGTTSTGKTAQHTYADNGTYYVRVAASDEYGGQASTDFPVAVANVAPLINANGAVIEENRVATVTGEITDPGAKDSFTIVVNWGEGSPQTINAREGSTSYSISHRYLDDNPTTTPSDSYTVHVNIKDKDGGQGNTLTGVTVNNVNPEVRIVQLVDEAGQEVGPSEVVLAGLPVMAYESYSDSGTLDTRTATRSWGDATPAENLGTVTSATSGSHTYIVPGTYRLMTRVTDDDTGTGIAGRVVQVVTPSAATTVAIDALSHTTSSRPTAAAGITAALASLQGQNGGAAHNGALDMLQQGAHQAALQKLEQSILHLEAAELADPLLSFTKLKSLIALTAKSVAVESVTRAEASASNSGQRKQVEAAKVLLSQGQSLLVLRNYTGAVDSFSKAIAKTQFAGGGAVRAAFNVMGPESTPYDPDDSRLSENSVVALLLGRRSRHYVFNFGA